MAKRTKRLIEDSDTKESVRLNKFLSDAGICSRREADKYITDGEVTVDGTIATVGTKVTKGQTILLKGQPVNTDQSLVLIAFHKPRGIVCTTDRNEKDNIIDYINYGKRIYPIGRLDKDSEGLILLTNDGNIVNKILRAGNNHEKEYIVTVNKQITADFLKKMAAGVPILDTVTKPCKVKAIDKFTFQIILTQGLNRQIRRMCEYFDYKVLTLKRIRIMNINLGHMQVGGYRNVTEKEIAGLNDLLSNSTNAPFSPNDYMDEEANDEDDFIIPAKKTKRSYNFKNNKIEVTSKPKKDTSTKFNNDWRSKASGIKLKTKESRSKTTGDRLKTVESNSKAYGNKFKSEDSQFNFSDRKFKSNESRKRATENKYKAAQPIKSFDNKNDYKNNNENDNYNKNEKNYLNRKDNKIENKYTKENEKKNDKKYSNRNDKKFENKYIKKSDKKNEKQNESKNVKTASYDKNISKRGSERPNRNIKINSSTKRFDKRDKK